MTSINIVQNNTCLLNTVIVSSLTEEREKIPKTIKDIPMGWQYALEKIDDRKKQIEEKEN